MFGFLKKKLSEFKRKIVGSDQAAQIAGDQEDVESAITPSKETGLEAHPSGGEHVGKSASTRKARKGIGKAKKTRVKSSKEGTRKSAKKPKTKKSADKEGTHAEPPTKSERTSKPPGGDSDQKREKKGIFSKLKRAISREVVLSDDELSDILWDLEVILLEADVSHEVAEDIIPDLRSELSGKTFPSKEKVFETILSLLKSKIHSMFKEPPNILADRKRPTIIMFIGPNGAGKTTTMAKLAKKVLDQGKSVIFAASDTFRAASIEQLQEHAKNLGVRVIKHDYGADPAAVAYDAVKSATARGIDFVFIDTAGRQDTNRNLLEELKKIKRVVKPDYIIYVDEGIAGNVILDRLRAFGELGISGIILTKMDLDAKGGGAITAASQGIPILYLGIGQGYDDIIPFDAESFVRDLLSSDSR